MEVDALFSRFLWDRTKEHSDIVPQHLGTLERGFLVVLRDTIDGTGEQTR